MHNQMPNMGMSNNNMMESLKSNMMTMLMINNMGGAGGKGGSTGNKDMFSIIYMFIATSVVDFIFKNAPIVINFFIKKYTDKLENIKRDLSNTTKDITDNKIKKKTASITVTINVNNPDNVLGHALLDFITNSKNTTHVSYIRESFILNQKDVINIEDDIFARMTESASTDTNGNQGSVSTNNNTGAGSNAGSGIVQIIEVYSFIKTTDQLRNFLDNIKQKYSVNIKNKLGNKRYYFNMHPLSVPMDIDKRKDMSRLPPNFIFVMKHFQTNRKFSNLFGEDIEAIRNRVNFFCKNRKWYDEKGIPYTLGLLLSGAPGTGKTSTIKCLANETNRHICNINLNNDMSKTQLENLFFNENINVINPGSGQNESYCIPLDQRIYVLEDVDCQSDIVMERANRNLPVVNTQTINENIPIPVAQNQTIIENIYKSPADTTVTKHYEDKHKVDLSFLLNLLDGVLENPGRIVIMTSNFPDTLDSALIRPGRIDVIAKFRNCTNRTVIEMMEFFYDTPLSEEDKARINILQEEIITPAEMSKIMFENFSDMEASITHMEKISSIKKQEQEQKDLLALQDKDKKMSEIYSPLSYKLNEQGIPVFNFGHKPNEPISVDDFLKNNPPPTYNQNLVEGFEKQPANGVKDKVEDFLSFRELIKDKYTNGQIIEASLGGLRSQEFSESSAEEKGDISKEKSSENLSLIKEPLEATEANTTTKSNKTVDYDYINTLRIQNDTVYIFMTMVLPSYRNNTKTYINSYDYYEDLLKQKVFSEYFYKKLICDCKLNFMNVIKNPQSIEQLTRHGEIHNIPKSNEYRIHIYGFFTPERLYQLGLIEKLSADGVIEPPSTNYLFNSETGFKNNDGVLTGSILDSSPLNSATFSIF